MNAEKISLCIAMLLLVCIIAPGETNSKNLDYSYYVKQQQQHPLPSFGYLTLVLVCMGLLIVLAVWCLKKIMNGRGVGASKSMKLKESLYLGNKTFLHVVEMAGHVVIIAVSPQHIARIMEVPSDELSEISKDVGENNGFADTLAAMISGLGGKKREKINSGNCKK